jgi:hypothetical protein
MSDIDILHQMIKDEATLALEERNNKKQVTLTEPQFTDVSVTIFGMPDKAIAIKADAFKSPNSVFNGSRGECKRADFVIVADTEGKKVIICIEMKATRDSEKEIIQQLEGAQCFVAYCQEIGKVFWKQDDFLKGYSYRFISINHISMPKRKTRAIRQSGIHDRPERMLKISSPHHLQFNQLAGAN